MEFHPLADAAPATTRQPSGRFARPSAVRRRCIRTATMQHSSRRKVGKGGGSFQDGFHSAVRHLIKNLNDYSER